MDVNHGLLNMEQLRALQEKRSAAIYFQNFQIPQTPSHNVSGEAITYTLHNQIDNNQEANINLPVNQINVIQSYNEERQPCIMQMHNNGNISTQLIAIVPDSKKPSIVFQSMLTPEGHSTMDGKEMTLKIEPEHYGQAWRINELIPQNDTSSEDETPKASDKAEGDNSNLPFACIKCAERFPSQAACDEHTKICTDKPTKYGCTLCKYKCQSAAIMNTHRRTHTGEKPFACDLCEYRAVQSNNLAKHMLLHKKEKPFRCQYCEYRCAQKNNLIVHERRHTGDKPFACTYCEYRTVQKPNLVKHMYLHTNDKPFSCNVCSYRCVQKSNLNKHVRRHNQGPRAQRQQSKRESKYNCELCNYKCMKKFSFDKHMLTKHPFDNTPPPVQYENVLEGLNLIAADKLTN